MISLFWNGAMPMKVSLAKAKEESVRMEMDFERLKFLVELKNYREASESHHARYQMYGAVVEFVDPNVRSFFFQPVWDTAGSRFPLN